MVRHLTENSAFEGGNQIVIVLINYLMGNVDIPAVLGIKAVRAEFVQAIALIAHIGHGYT
jgi:hypothetical protein